MSPININSLISGLAPRRLGLGQPHGAVVPQEQSPQASGQEDVFVQGQWWRNHAVGAGSEPGGDALVYKRSDVRPKEAGGKETGSLSGAHDVATGGQEETSGQTEAEELEAGSAGSRQPKSELQLTDQELLVLRELQKADQSVRAHEMAHITAAGGLAKGGASFKYQRGPDGKNYAVGGEVHIDTAQEPTPDATIEKMRQVRRAALAPADPSPQDQKVAAQATILMGKAMQELRLPGASGGQDHGEASSSDAEGLDGSLRQVYQESGRDLANRTTSSKAKHSFIKNYIDTAQYGSTARNLPGRMERVA